MGDIHGLLGADPNDLEEFLDAAGLCEPCLTVPIGSLYGYCSYYRSSSHVMVCCLLCAC